MTEKYIIDVDTGVDDAQAIILALSRPDVEVLAITCVAGNCDVDLVCLNTLKVLSVCNRLDVPVYKGASKALLGDRLPATFYHGNDGLGDANLDTDVSLEQVQKDYAVTALVNLVNKYPGEIHLVALAPLTNIALALREDPEFGGKLKNVTIMGGNVEGKGILNNASLMCAEFNFASDPDAAHVVLNELKVSCTLLPWEISLTSATGQPWAWFDKWVQTNTTIGRFNKAIVEFSVNFQRNVSRLPIYRSCDLNTMATVIDPGIITGTSEVYATVELHGKHTRGMMVVDWRGVLGEAPNMKVVTTMDSVRARGLFDNMVN